MAEKGIINGYADGSFRPDDAITRAEFAKIVTIAFGFTDDSAESSFEDVPENEWCYEYVSALSKLGIIKGVGENAFGKNEPISRQDMAVMLSRVMMYKGKVEAYSKPEFTDAMEIDDYAQDAVGMMQKLGVISGTNNNCFDPHGNTTRAQAAKVVSVIMDFI